MRVVGVSGVRVKEQAWQERGCDHREEDPDHPRLVYHVANRAASRWRSSTGRRRVPVEAVQDEGSQDTRAGGVCGSVRGLLGGLCVVRGASLLVLPPAGNPGGGVLPGTAVRGTERAGQLRFVRPLPLRPAVGVRGAQPRRGLEDLLRRPPGGVWGPLVGNLGKGAAPHVAGYLLPAPTPAQKAVGPRSRRTRPH